VSKKYLLESRYSLTSHIVVILPMLILLVSVAYSFFLTRLGMQT
tara:strand:- start:1 stop:132 length:132 start_codon:yes stop_codon:yes gene_type:complete